MVGGHIKVWLGLAGALFFLTPLLRGPDALIEQVEREVNYARSHMGAAHADRFIKRANEFFDESIVRTGIAGLVKRTETPADLQRQDFAAPAKHGGELVKAYGTGLLANLYALILRSALAFAWLPLLLPFIVAAIWDAIQMRRRKEYRLEYINPGTYGAGLHVVVFCCFVPLVYFVAPLAVSPLMVPGLFIPAALAANVVIRNMQRISV